MKLPLILAGLAVLVIGGGAASWQLSRIGIHQGYAPVQPIAFPHKLHAGENKIPCLYCHYAARSSRHAGIPPQALCMNCHQIMEKQSVEIEKLLEAVQLQRPIRWVKIHNLPDFVYFNHSRHVLSGVACQTCHGPVEQMDRVSQQKPLTMGWCLDCHRERAHQPSATLHRAAANLATPAKPAPGLDCSACHY